MLWLSAALQRSLPHANAPRVSGSLALVIGWLYARMNVYSRDSVAKLTGVEDPAVPGPMGR